MIRLQYEFQIAEVKLKELIEQLYRNNGRDRIPLYQQNQIERDVESISNIFKIRKRIQATSLKNCKAIFMTSNVIIAYAAKIFEKTNWTFRAQIPVCLTDILLSTIMWANYPAKNSNLKIRQLIGECYGIIELDNRLLNRYYDDVNKLHNNNAITNEQYLLLSSSNLAYTLLEEKTLNDIEEYTDKTPREILEDLQSRIYYELEQKKDRLAAIDKRIVRIARGLAKLTFFFLAVLLIIIALVLKFWTPKFKNIWYNLPFYIFAGLIAIFGFLRWIEKIPTKGKIEESFERFYHRLLTKIIGTDR